MLAVLCAGLVCVATAKSHETDQFTVPVGQQYADLGPYFNDYFLAAIKEGVRRTNKRIDIELGGDGGQFSRVGEGYGRGVLYTSDSGSTGRTLSYLHSGEAVAVYVLRSIPDAVTLIEGLESVLHRDEIKEQYPGKVVAFHPSDFDCVYAKAHFPLDPRSLFRIWLSSTVKAYGTHFGTDKIGHFCGHGLSLLPGLSQPPCQGG